MRRALTRLWEWCYHPSIRHNPTPRGKAILYRYPSPGSILPREEPRDYRRPYSTSEYNVRNNYGHTYHQQVERKSEFISPPHQWSVTDKLINLGFLKADQVENKQAVEQATKAYEKYYQVSVQQPFLVNDFKFDCPNPYDREAIREAIAKNFATCALDHHYNKFEGDDAYKHSPDYFVPESLDLYSDPHFQQTRIEHAYQLQEIANQRAEGIEVRKGENRFWKALDDSNDPENIKKVQEKIGDENPLSFELRTGKIEMEFDKNGDVIYIHRKEQ